MAMKYWRRRQITVLALVGSFGAALAMAPPSQSASCAVVGVGVLGTHLCRQLLQEWPSSSSVTGITATARNHGTIRAALDDANDERLHLQTADDPMDRKCTHVVFCAPPSGFDDYPSAVKEAAEKYWLGPDRGGTFVFTSSGAVYGPGEGGHVTEDSPVADNINSPRVTRLLAAEQAALDAGGCVLRLAGLYTLERGAHNYWMTVNKPIPSAPNGIVNQVHYEDAAGACFAALQAVPASTDRRVFLISDGNPQTRIEICQSALQAAVYRDAKLPQFDSTAKGGGGKVYHGAASDAALQWKRRYPSFDAYMKSMA